MRDTAFDDSGMDGTEAECGGALVGAVGRADPGSDAAGIAGSEVEIGLLARDLRRVWRRELEPALEAYRADPCVRTSISLRRDLARYRSALDALEAAVCRSRPF